VDGALPGIDRIGGTMQPLTSRQRQVLDIIRGEVQRHGVMPSLRRIAARLKVSSPSGVARHLKALERKGYLLRQNPETSAFQLVEEAPRLPLVGTIPAGTPQIAYEQAELLDLNPRYFGKGRLVAVRVSGESMAGDAIADGDIAIISLEEGNGNDILAIRVDQDEVTLKRMRRSGAWVELVPSNPEYPLRRVRADRVQIVGRLSGIIRRT